jgi:coniferyl-aldehyde dehydrogenase
VVRARLINLFEGQTPDASLRKFAPHIVISATDEMDILQREILGPLLPIKTYCSKEEVVDHVASHPRPLALYIYSNDKQLQNYYLDTTMSGGVTVNDGPLHAGLHRLPFGGIGNSGMGHYHGYAGLTTFSKMRPVFCQGPIRALDKMMPPYEVLPTKLMNFMIKRKS